MSGDAPSYRPPCCALPRADRLACNRTITSGCSCSCHYPASGNATKSRDYGRGFAEALRLVHALLTPTFNAPSDLCHNGHAFEPGIDADRPHEPGDPRWCDVCGEARR